MTTVLLILAVFLVFAGLVSLWAWLLCLGHGAERMAARPIAVFAAVFFILAAMSAGAALF